MARKGQADEIERREKAKKEGKPGVITVEPTKKKRRKRQTPRRIARRIFNEQLNSHKRSAIPTAPFNRAIADALRVAAPGGARISRAALRVLREATEDYLVETLKWANERGPCVRKQPTLTHKDIQAEVKQQKAWVLRLQQHAK
tara:strand:- start:198 stop:629 length:432 start_codon:yes stop_codon:yes gene_type:complete